MARVLVSEEPFVVTGEFITNHARTLLKENLILAFRTIKDIAVAHITDSHALSILCGTACLSGDSTSGLYVTHDSKTIYFKGAVLSTHRGRALLRQALQESKVTISTPYLYKISGNHGWLSKVGKFYPCESQGHSLLAEDLESTDQDLTGTGWVKLSQRKFYKQSRSEITQTQLDLIIDWCTEEEEPLPYWFPGQRISY